MAAELVHEPRREADVHFVNLESWIPTVAVSFNAEGHMSGAADAIAENLESLNNEQLTLSLGGVILFVPLAAGGKNGN